MSPFTSAVGAAYVATLIFGVPGNAWVISSVVRSWRPRSASALTPSDRLRTYIGLLGVIDLCVVLVLGIRCAYLFLPNATISTKSCQIIFIIDHLMKLTSLSCLMCISVERYITIRKPFSSRVRKRLIQLMPLFALVLLALIFAGINVLSSDVITDRATRMNCVRASSELELLSQGDSTRDGDVKPIAVTTRSMRSVSVSIADWTLAAGFLFQLCTVSFSYSQIVRHVRRKFWQRKARVVANTHIAARKPLIVTEPRYMKDMTAAIVRVACFHVVCLLPYCVIQALPNAVRLVVDRNLTQRALSEYATTALRFLNAYNYGDALAWLAVVADWLTYVNSAGNWIFYAAMNRDLRSIIRFYAVSNFRATTERRKRSTMSQHSPSTLHRSLRRQMTQSLRFFYSINSYKSNANSLDDSCFTVHNQPLTDSASGRLLIGADSPSMSPPVGNGYYNNLNSQNHLGHYHKCSTVSANGVRLSNANGGVCGAHTGCSEGTRNCRGQTYCSPRTVHRDNQSNGDVLAKSNGDGKQIFFPATGINGVFTNGVCQNGMSQLATMREASSATLSNGGVTQVCAVNAAIKQHIDAEEEEKQSSNGGEELEEQMPSPSRPIFSRIFLLSAVKMPVTITAKLGRSPKKSFGRMPTRTATATARHFANNIIASNVVSSRYSVRECLNS